MFVRLYVVLWAKNREDKMFAELTATGAECEMFAEKLRKISRCYFFTVSVAFECEHDFCSWFQVKRTQILPPVL
jgi:hypothetical protein